jgi:hypothetical protein
MGVAQNRVRSLESEAQVVDAPNEIPPRTWAGRGQGACCDLCHEPIDTDQIEYEVELAADLRSRTVRLHLDCYEQWVVLHPPSGQRR